MVLQAFLTTKGKQPPMGTIDDFISRRLGNVSLRVGGESHTLDQRQLNKNGMPLMVSDKFRLALEKVAKGEARNLVWEVWGDEGLITRLNVSSPTPGQVKSEMRFWDDAPYETMPTPASELSVQSFNLFRLLEEAVERYMERDTTKPATLEDFLKTVRNKVALATDQEGDYWDGRVEALQEVLEGLEELTGGRK